MAFFRRRSSPAGLIPLAAQPEWERYYLFESRGEEPHLLDHGELAARCGVDHDVPERGDRFGPAEMCEAQWSCTAAYYAWSDALAETTSAAERRPDYAGRR
jgi:hypothetical protein